MKKFWIYFFLALHTGLSILLSIALLSPLIDPSSTYWPAIIALLFPYLILSQIFFILIWLRLKKRSAFISLFFLILSVPAIDRTFQFGTDTRLQTRNSIKIMSYNMHNMYDYKAIEDDEEKEKVKEEWRRLIRHFDGIDILGVQEYSSGVREFLIEEFNHDYGASCPGSGNTRILSRHPVIDKGCIYFDNIKKRYQTIWADIKIPNSEKNDYDTIRVYSTQLESNKISDYEKELVAKEEATLAYIYNQVRNMFATYKEYAPIRINQIKKIMEHMQGSPHPVVLLGDLNEIPQSHLYRIVTDRLEDTFQSEGNDFGTTYAGSLPLLRIDYILTDPEFEHIDFHVGNDLKMSDHYPVMTSVRLK